MHDKNLDKKLSSEDADSTKEEVSSYKITIKASSYDFKLLDIAMQTIYKCILEGGIQCNPPSPLPTQKTKFTIRRAPSIYKSSFEKFEFRIHARIIRIHDANNLDNLICLSKADIPRAVNIDIKILTQQEIKQLAERRKKNQLQKDQLNIRKLKRKFT